MSVPLDLLLERLRQYDEVQVLELLEIRTDDLLEAFVHKVRERQMFLSSELELWDEDGEAVEEEEDEEEDF